MCVYMYSIYHTVYTYMYSIYMYVFYIYMHTVYVYTLCRYTCLYNKYRRIQSHIIVPTCIYTSKSAHAYCV